MEGGRSRAISFFSCEVLHPHHPPGTSSLVFKCPHTDATQQQNHTRNSPKIEWTVLQLQLERTGGIWRADSQRLDWPRYPRETRLCFIFSRAAQRGARKKALMLSAAAPLHWRLINSDFIIPTGKLLVMVFVHLFPAEVYYFRCALHLLSCLLSKADKTVCVSIRHLCNAQLCMKNNVQ